MPHPRPRKPRKPRRGRIRKADAGGDRIVGEAQLRSAIGSTGGVLDGADVVLALPEGSTLRFVGGEPPRERDVWQAIGRVLEQAVGQDVALGGHDSVHIRPLVDAGVVHGALLLRRDHGPVSRSDRAVAGALAGWLAAAAAAEQARSRLEGALARVLPDDVIRSLVEDPAQAALGGAVREISVLFADLRGFTSYSERFPPEDVVAMLNRYFEIGVPVLINHGGTITSFIGDAVMAIFNAPAAQPEHAALAARAGLALQEATRPEAGRHPGWPLFRVGIHTGPALVGNIGSSQRSTYTAIGDTVNVAARLEGHAEAGQVVISGRCRAALPPAAAVDPLGSLQVKGRAHPVEAMVLRSLGDAVGRASQTTSLSAAELAHLRAGLGRKDGG